MGLLTSWDIQVDAKMRKQNIKKNILRIVHVNSAVSYFLRPADPTFESRQIVGVFFTNHGSQNGQGIIFHQPRFPSNSRGISLTIRNLLGEIGRVLVTMKFDQRICVTLKHRNSMSQHNLPQVFVKKISQKLTCSLKKGPFQ